jgi:glycosyltransferase involved in cell wall biosynthesis
MRIPELSVVICTCNRPDTLEPTLASLTHQAHRSFEVVVVDQSSDDRSRRIVELVAAVDARFHYVHLESRGLSRAYNTGIKATRAPLIAFTDDDCIAPWDWLQQIEEAFNANPKVQLLYGQVLVPLDVVARGMTQGVIPAWTIPKRRVLDRRRFTVTGMGANFAARRSLFDVVGAFDEVLGGGGPLESSQDFDFVYRVFRCGHATLLEPDVKVYHYGYREGKAWESALRSYGIGVGGFYTKHARLGDVYAVALLSKALGRSALRAVRHRMMPRRSDGGDAAYIRGILNGMRGSFRFGIDRSSRLYRTG